MSLIVLCLESQLSVIHIYRGRHVCARSSHLRHAHESLQFMLLEFDRLALEGEEGGWPFYAERVEQLNQAFSDHSEL
jgi:hypothetical protein